MLSSLMLAPMLVITLPPAVLLFLLVERPCSLAQDKTKALMLPGVPRSR